MVNDRETVASGPAGDPAGGADGARGAERRLAIGYAAGSARAGLAALLALDDRLGGVLRTTRQPLIGQIRLTWWRDALLALDHAAPPAEPVLAALAASVLPHGVAGADLAPMIDGWGALLDDDVPTPAAMQAHADARGAALFGVAGVLLGAGSADPLAAAGKGWALADLSRHLSAGAERAAALAQGPLAIATTARWSLPARALGALTHLASLDLRRPDVPPGAPSRVARLLFHRVTGR